MAERPEEEVLGRMMRRKKNPDDFLPLDRQSSGFRCGEIWPFLPLSHRSRGGQLFKNGAARGAGEGEAGDYDAADGFS